MKRLRIKTRTKKKKGHLKRMRSKMEVQKKTGVKTKRKEMRLGCKKRVVIQIERITIPVNCRPLVGKNVSISFVTQRKYLKKSDQKWKLKGTDSFARTAMTTT